MLPCALRISETFYGNGESYLFSFYDGFKVSQNSTDRVSSKILHSLLSEHVSE